MIPRIVHLLGLVLMVSGRVCAQAPILDEDGSFLMPQTAEIYTGRSLQLHTRYVGCADRARMICAVILSEREVIEWRVNGIPGGSEEVGTITGGSSATYTAPRSVPSGNPVSVSAIVKGNGKEQVQLVSEIRIVEPSKWQGSVSYTFTGLLDANAHDQAQVAHFDQVWAWMTPEDDMAESDVTKVSLSVQYLVRGVMVDSVAQDMSGMVVLELGMPTAVFGYHRRAIDGCGGTTLTTWVGKIDQARYADALPTINLMINADQSSVLPYVPPPIMTSQGVQTSLDCEHFFRRTELAERPEDFDTPTGTELISNGTLETTVSPMGDPTAGITVTAADFAFTHAFAGQPAQGHVYAGAVTRKTMMRFHGQDIPGLLTVQWSFAPQ